MSYIGKNPEADSVKLKGSATEPSGTAVDGQVYFNTGAGSISKGMKVYKNSQFVAIDKQLGDAETMQLLKAADIPAIDFSLSLTSTTVGGNGAVPFESSTGDFDGTAAFTNSSTGDALLTDDSADLVFHYTTQATNSADNDFWGIPLTVPRAFRGGNLVVEFKYRTEIATGTMDDGYFNIAMQDRSAMIIQTLKSTTAGAIAAGANVELTGKTYANAITGTTLTVAVGDRVFVESGTGTAGDQANDIVDCYITSVSSTDNNVTLSKDIVGPSGGSGKFVTGWLTGYDTGGQIDAFASDTNKDGTSKKLAFKTDADTQQVSLWFFVKGTSTVKHELFFDNVLLSANKFLQASSQTKTESYNIPQQSNVWDGSGTSTYFTFDASLIEAGPDTPPLADSNLVEIADITGPGTVGTVTAVKAKQNITLHTMITMYASNSGELHIVNSSEQNLCSSYAPNSAAAGYEVVSASINLAKDDYVYYVSHDSGARDASFNAVAVPQTSPVILLESQDEIFTSWQDYTPTIAGSASTDVNFQWRRVGGEMEIKGRFFIGTRSSTVTTSFTIPAGYAIDTSNLKSKVNVLGYWQYIDQTNFYVTDNGRSGVLTWDADTDKLYPSYMSSSSSIWLLRVGTDTWASGDSRYVTYQAKVPIQGWNANFNPLLSMPLVDFGTWENTFTCLAAFDSTGVTSITIPAGTPDNVFTGTSTKVATGRWSIGLGSRFTQQPAITVTQITAHNERSVFGDASSSTSVGWQNSLLTSGAYEDFSGTVSITVIAQGADHIEPPQPTAAVIKPAVAIVADKLAEGASAQTIASGTSFTTLDCDVIHGESWFVSLNSTNNGFTLEPGNYELALTMPIYNSGVNGWFNMVLYDQTNSKYVPSSYMGNVAMDVSGVSGQQASSYCVVNPTTSTEYRMMASCYVTAYVGYISASIASAGIIGNQNQILIRKLK